MWVFHMRKICAFSLTESAISERNAEKCLKSPYFMSSRIKNAFRMPTYSEYVTRSTMWNAFKIANINVNILINQYTHYWMPAIHSIMLNADINTDINADINADINQCTYECNNVFSFLGINNAMRNAFLLAFSEAITFFLPVVRLVFFTPVLKVRTFFLFACLLKKKEEKTSLPSFKKDQTDVKNSLLILQEVK